LDSLVRIEPFQWLTTDFQQSFFCVLRRLGFRLRGGEIVDEAVDLVEQALPLLGAVIVFRHDRLLVLVEPVDHLDERSDGLELPAPDRLSDDAQGGHQAFELQMRVVDAAVVDPLAENFRHDLANPLGADPLLAGDLVIGLAFAQAREDALPALGLGRDVDPAAGFGGLFHDGLTYPEKQNYSILF